MRGNGVMSWLKTVLGLGLLSLTLASDAQIQDDLPILAGETDLEAVYHADVEQLPDTHIEIAANGDFRVQEGRESYLLGRGGVLYLVVAGPGNPLVYRISDLPDVHVDRSAAARKAASALYLAEVVTVAGRAGHRLRNRTLKGKDSAEAIFVIADDPALYRIGKALMWSAQARKRLRLGVVDDPGAIEASQYFKWGMPLLMGPRKFVRVSTAPIRPERFQLPALPLPPERTRADWVRDSQGSTERRSRSTAFKRALYAEGQLWLLSDDGALTRIAEGSAHAAKLRTPGPVMDMCKTPKGPMIINGPVGARYWTLHLWQRDHWVELGKANSRKDGFIGLICGADHVTILAQHWMSDWPGPAVRLSETIGSGVVATLFDTQEALFVGINAGEWGGGLSKIDRKTGTVRAIDRSGKKLCEGPLNSACDPVNGLAEAPGKPGCLLASIGLVHFVPHGRIVEICGDVVRTVLRKPYTLEPDPQIDLAEPEPDLTVAYYSMVGVKDGAWFIGEDGLTRVVQDGQFATRPLPDFKSIDGIMVAFDQPDIVLVLSSINQRVSMGGAMAMIVPR